MTRAAADKADRSTQAVSKALRTGKLVVQADAQSLQLDRIKTYQVDSSQHKYTSVTVPLAGKYSMTSNLTVVLDGRGKVVQYSETHVTKNDAGNFKVTQFANGKLSKVNNTDMRFMSDQELQRADAPGGGATTRDVGSTVACVVAVLGVSGAVGYLIVGACAGACAAPVVGTAICVACIGAYAAVGGASITAVASCFK